MLVISRSSFDTVINNLVMTPGCVADCNGLQGISLDLGGHSKVVKLISINQGLLLALFCNSLRSKTTRFMFLSCQYPFSSDIINSC